MNRYVIDYSTARRPPERRVNNSWLAIRRSNRRMRRALRRSAILICLLGCGIALVGWLRLDLNNQQLQRANDQHRLQYDSLLANKLEADKKIRQLQRHLDSLRAP